MFQSLSLSSKREPFQWLPLLDLKIWEGVPVQTRSSYFWESHLVRISGQKPSEAPLPISYHYSRFQIPEAGRGSSWIWALDAQESMMQPTKGASVYICSWGLFHNCTYNYVCVCFIILYVFIIIFFITFVIF